MVRIFRGSRLMEPYGIFSLFPGIHRAHRQFIAKTVMVKDNDVEGAFQLLNRLMAREGLLDHLRKGQRHEPPWMYRRRISYEISTAIYNEDMDRKINFIMRKNRRDPFPATAWV